MLSSKVTYNCDYLTAIPLAKGAGKLRWICGALQWDVYWVDGDDRWFITRNVSNEQAHFRAGNARHDSPRKCRRGTNHARASASLSCTNRPAPQCIHANTSSRNCINWPWVFFFTCKWCRRWHYLLQRKHITPFRCAWTTGTIDSKT